MRCLAVALVLALAVPAVWGVPGAEGAAPTVTLAFDDDSKECPVPHWDDIVVEYAGTVTVGTVCHGTSLNITLESSSPSGWSVILSPSQMSFPTSGGTAIFYMNLKVPRGTGYLHLEKVEVVAHVNMTDTSLEYDSPTTQATLLVTQEHGIEVAEALPENDMGPSGTLTLEYTVTNRGSARDIIGLDVDNAEELEEEGITVRVSPKNLTLDRGEAGTFRVRITVDMADFGEYEVWLTFYSALTPERDEDGVAQYRETSVRVVAKSVPDHVAQAMGREPADGLMLTGGIAAVVLVALALAFQARRSKGKKGRKRRKGRKEPRSP